MQPRQRVTGVIDAQENGVRPRGDGVLVPAAGVAQTEISIDQTLQRCKAAGNGLVPGVQPVQSDLKKKTSLIGMADLNYIYQNDIDNRHFCESMLLMSSQVPAGTGNPYVGLFTRKRAVTTMAALADVQFAFDYAIARTDPPEAKVRASVDTVRKGLNGRAGRSAAAPRRTG
jgi:hypothetical protein